MKAVQKRREIMYSDTDKLLQGVYIYDKINRIITNRRFVYANDFPLVWQGQGYGYP